MSEQFENILKRQGNGSMKWEKAYIEKRFKIAEDNDIYPLFIADMDYPMATCIHDQLVELMQEPDFGYFHIQEGFYNSIIAWQKKVHHLDIKKEWILPSLGTVTSLNIACDIYAKDEDILILTPVYGAFKKCAGVGNCVTLPLLMKEHEYEIDFKGMRNIFEERNIKVLIFCNPHNPSGRIWRHAELLELVLLCKEYNVMILSDEIHSDLLVSDKPFTSLFSFSDAYENILISTSPNKTFNLSGLSTSYVISKNEGILKAIQAYFDRLHLSCNRMGVMMIENAYTNGYEWYLELIEQIKGNIEIVCSSLSNTTMEVMRPDSGYLVWIKCPKVKDVDQFVYDLAKDTHVLIESGSRFIENYEGWIRMNVATSSTLLKEAMKRFVKFYLQYEN